MRKAELAYYKGKEEVVFALRRGGGCRTALAEM